MARIVIVDDDDIVIDVVTEALEEVGHIVSAVDHGDDAADAIDKSQPDFLILDYNLPGKSGLQILREVRQLAHMSNMPVMMLTAQSGQILVGRASLEGADDYVLKPFDVVNLVDRVEALLSRS